MKSRTLICSACALALLTISAYAEPMQVFQPDSKATQKIRIEGTSTVHDWQMESPLPGGVLEVGAGFPIEPGQEAKPGPITAKGKVFVAVRSLKSLEKDGKAYSESMDKIVYDKLKFPAMKFIVYQLGELTLKEAPKSKDGAYVFDSKGELAVAGVTNKISMPVNITPMGNKTLHITGNTKVKMTDYGIQPPSPTGLGLLIKTGDEVKILFDWTVVQKAPAADAAASK